MTALTDSAGGGGRPGSVEAGNCWPIPPPSRASAKGRRRTMSPMWTWRYRSFCGSAWRPWPRTSSSWGGAGQYPLDWSRPCWILDPVDGTTNLIHQLPAQRDFPGLGGGWTNCLWCGIQSLYGGVLHRPPGRRSIPKRGPIQVSAVSPAGGQPPVHGHRPRPAGAGGCGFPADAGAV